MTYQIIDNFAAGLDTRKSPLTSPPGTLTRLVNAAVTPGGEIAKRRAFVNVATVTGSFGLAATAASLYVFGKNVVPSLPSWSVPGVTLKGMKVPNADATLQQMDYDVFDGRIYLACRTGGATVPPAAPTAAENPHYYEDASGGASTLSEGAGKGYYVRTYQTKIYTVLGKNLSFSCVGSPLKWVDGTVGSVTYVGAGFINLSTQDADAEILTSLEVYYDQLAVFASESVQIWAVDPDDSKNQFVQLLRQAGTLAPRSPLQYGSGDVLYLDQSGIRSLKAKDSSNSAAVSDIGSPVDPVVQALILAKGQAYMDKAIALLEPSVGRFWMVFEDRILVLSYFPGPKITAWSEYLLSELGAAKVQHATTCNGRIFLRDTQDRIWLFGGNDGQQFNNCGVEIRLPYLDGKKPGHKKQFSAIDATVNGTWTVKVSFDFNNPDAEETVATISVPTWNAGAGELQGYDSHFSLRFYNNDANQATISNCAIHYEMADDKT